jgi:hypothetical protein
MAVRRYSRPLSLSSAANQLGLIFLTVFLAVGVPLVLLIK